MVVAWNKQRQRVCLRIGLLVVSVSVRIVGAETNTNQCIFDLEGIQPCGNLAEDGSGVNNATLGFGENFSLCCDGLRKLIQDGCDFNPVVPQVLGEEDSQVFLLEGLCRIYQPFDWVGVKTKKQRNEQDIATYEYGCNMSDLEIDAARYRSMDIFMTAVFESNAYTTTTNDKACFDTPAFVEALQEAFTEDIVYAVPYGIGTYTGIHDVAEYLSMALPAMNSNFWVMAGYDQSKKYRLDVSQDGSIWMTGSTEMGAFLDGLYPYENKYGENLFQFEPCQTKIAYSAVMPMESLRDYVELFVQASRWSDRYGIQDICRYHTVYCQEEYPQYDSEEECLVYMTSLPSFTDQCGINRPLAGHSLPCKFKHHFMIAENPELHCPHIGKRGVQDKNGKLKCDDEIECQDDIGQDTWPTVRLIDNLTPTKLLEIYRQNDVGYQDKIMPCALSLPPSNKDEKNTTAEPSFVSPSPPSNLAPLIPSEMSPNCKGVADVFAYCLETRFTSCILRCEKAGQQAPIRTDCTEGPPLDYCQMFQCCSDCEEQLLELFSCEAEARGCHYDCNDYIQPEEYKSDSPWGRSIISILFASFLFAVHAIA